MVDRVDQQRPGDVPGDTVPTGFPSIDRILGVASDAATS